jgi:hypothetical protein
MSLRESRFEGLTISTGQILVAPYTPGVRADTYLPIGNVSDIRLKYTSEEKKRIDYTSPTRANKGSIGINSDYMLTGKLSTLGVDNLAALTGSHGAEDNFTAVAVVGEAHTLTQAGLPCFVRFKAVRDTTLPATVTGLPLTAVAGVDYIIEAAGISFPATSNIVVPLIGIPFTVDYQAKKQGVIELFKNCQDQYEILVLANPLASCVDAGVAERASMLNIFRAKLKYATDIPMGAQDDIEEVDLQFEILSAPRRAGFELPGVNSLSGIGIWTKA